MLLTKSIQSFGNAQTHVILAKMLYHFDFELAPGEIKDSWQARLRAIPIWEKPPLMVKLTERSSKEIL